MKRHLLGLTTCLAVLLISVSAYSHSAYHRGRLAAHLDMLGGKHVIKTVGHLPEPWRAVKQFLARHEIEVQNVPCCPVSFETTNDEVRGYNEVSQAEIERLYGKRMLERAYEQADAANRIVCY